MRSLIVTLLFLIASVWLGVEFARHPGYALFSYGQWVLEMPLWTAVLGLFFTFFIFHFLLRLFHTIRHLDQRIGGWLANRRRNKAYDKTHRGLLGIMEEQWSLAERHLLDGIHQSKNPVINYLAAAEAAHAQKAFERSEAYLQKAYQVAPQEQVVIGLVQAKLQQEQGHIDQALKILTQLRQLSPYHPSVLRQLEKLYIRLSDWQSLIGLLPALRKAKVISQNQYQVFEKNIYCEMLNEAEKKNLSIHAVREMWHSMPKKIRLQPDVLERYANLLRGDRTSAEEIEPLIRKVLHKEWNDNLAKLYGTLTTTDPMRQLSLAETWIKQYGKKSILLLTLGRLCSRCQLWGKARQYLEEGLKQHASSETQLELARLLEQMGEIQLALRHYKDGLELATAT